MTRCGSAVVSVVLVWQGSLALAQVVAAPEVVWQDQLGTTRVAAAVDAAGHVVVDGRTMGSLVDPSPKDGYVEDAFARAYDAPGSVLWQDQLGGSDRDGATGVTVDALGRVIVVGGTEGRWTDRSESRYAGAFVRVYDVGGRMLWEDQIGTNGSSLAWGVTVDTAGRVGVAGITDGNWRGRTRGRLFRSCASTTPHPTDDGGGGERVG